MDAQETLDLLTAEGTPTLAEVQAQVAVLLEDLRINVPQLPAIQALINANASPGSAVGEARDLIDGAVNGPLEQATLEALAAAGVDPELFLLAPLLDEAALELAVDAAVDGGLPPGLDQALVDALLLDITDGDEVLSVASVTTLATLGIDVADFETAQFDLAAIGAALDAVVTVEAQQAAAALVAALNAGDVAAILEAEAALEALVGENVDLTALVNLQAQLVAAQAVIDAQADLDAAITAVNSLRVRLDALDIDLGELEELFDTVIQECTGTSGGSGDNDNDGAGGSDGADGAGGSNGRAVTVGGGTNRGMNVQTAAATAGTDPAGISALAAGIGFMVVVGAAAIRRIRTS